MGTLKKIVQWLRENIKNSFFVSIIFIIGFLFYLKNNEIIVVVDFIRKSIGEENIKGLIVPIYKLIRSIYSSEFLKILIFLWIILFVINRILEHYNERFNLRENNYMIQFKRTLFNKYLGKALTTYWIIFKLIEIIAINGIKIERYADYCAIIIQACMIILNLLQFG